MPLHTNNLVIVLQSLYNLHLVQVHSVADVQVPIVASRSNEASINRVGHASHLLAVELLLCEALPHIEVPNANRAVQMAHSCKAIHRHLGRLPRVRRPSNAGLVLHIASTF